jgi:FkbM family methyltransferase
MSAQITAPKHDLRWHRPTFKHNSCSSKGNKGTNCHMFSTRSKIALATMVKRPIVAARRLLGRPGRLRARRGGIAWDLDLHEGIDFSIWLLGAFERRTVSAYSRIVEAGHVVFDVGANIGAHTLPLAKRVGAHGRVYAFEPVRWAIDKLRLNLSLNPGLAASVVANQAMLVDRQGAVVPSSIHASWPLESGQNIHSTLGARLMPTDGATALTLDGFVTQEGISRLDFMKIDVDGYECQVLRGGRETLRRFRPPIVIELSPHSLEESGETLDILLDLLADAEYELEELVRQVPLPHDRAELFRRLPVGGGINALAVARPTR